jgi:hypothetical protein
MKLNIVSLYGIAVFDQTYGGGSSAGPVWPGRGLPPGLEGLQQRGDWREGKVWRRAPDGRIVIDVLGYQRWVESPRAAVHGEKINRQMARLPVQMDLVLRREKGAQGDGLAKA